MYFEARSHELLPCTDAADAVGRVHRGEVMHYQCPCWVNSKGQRVALVDDSHINCLDFGECAVVNLETKRQLESITFAWCRDEGVKLRYVQKCENGEGLSPREVIVPLTDADRDVPARFECSCCGEGFTSTLRKQLPYDQDCGHGFCPSCSSRHQ